MSATTSRIAIAAALAALTVLASVVGCSSNKDADLVRRASSADVGYLGGDVVTNGAFTNVYVYPTPSTETWEQHIASLRADASQFSRAAIDAVTDRMMTPGWPSYFDPLYQYHCGFSTDCGINPPQFFGSGVATQECVDAALSDAYNGVVQWATIRTLANCHTAGMDPSPQVNLIFSPDMKIGDLPKSASDLANHNPDMCSTAGANVSWHTWGLNVPNLAAVPTAVGCAPIFTAFTENLSHEIVEILTDPAGLGYTDPSYVHEVADECASLPNADAYTTFGGDSLARYWSNADGNCQPRLDSPSGSTSTTWILGDGSPLARFTGDVHDLSLSVPSARVNTDATATQVLIVIQTGADDLRGGSDNADVTLSFVGGSTLTTNVNEGHHWNNGQTHSAILNLPNPAVRVSDITGITLSTHFGGGISGDNWNVNKVGLVVSFANGSSVTVPPHPIHHSWLDASELPLVRFAGDVHDLRLPVPPIDPDRVAQALDLVISTGNDDLRGGSNAGDNCDVMVELASGEVLTLTNVNQGQSWAGWTKHTVSIPIPTGLMGGGLTAATLHTGFGGGAAGDNWNVERVQLIATIDPASLLTITISEPRATEYAHGATLKLDYGATDAEGPGVAQVVASLDGSTTVAGHTLSSGQSLPLLQLALGPHTFDVTASDLWGNSRSSLVTFNIVVTSRSIAEEVNTFVASGQIVTNQGTPLISKLNAAAAARARGQCDTAANLYRAFIHQVEAQGGKHIDPAAAELLIGDAQYLIDHCP